MKSIDRYDSLIRYYCEKTNVDFNMIKGQGVTESAMNPKAVSPVGAKGLYQFMDPTFEQWGKGGDVFNPEDAIDAATRYMAYLIKYFDGDLTCAIAAYNWGMGNVREAYVAQGEGFLEVAPEETQNYVQKVLSFMDN